MPWLMIQVNRFLRRLCKHRAAWDDHTVRLTCVSPKPNWNCHLLKLANWSCVSTGSCRDWEARTGSAERAQDLRVHNLGGKKLGNEPTLNRCKVTCIVLNMITSTPERVKMSIIVCPQNLKNCRSRMRYACVWSGAPKVQCSGPHSLQQWLRFCCLTWQGTFSPHYQCQCLGSEFPLMSLLISGLWEVHQQQCRHKARQPKQQKSGAARQVSCRYLNITKAVIHWIQSILTS